MAGTDALRATFFEECEDLLSRMGEGLNRIADAGEATEIEVVHEVFRAVHSIKGGAGAFGLASLVSFAHVFETVLDLMRSGKMIASAPVMHTLLRAYDVLADLVEAARDDGPDPAHMQQLFVELDVLAESDPAAADDEPIEFQPLQIDIFGSADRVEETAASPEFPMEPGLDFVVSLAPKGDLYASGHEPAALLRALGRLGEGRVRADAANVPPLSDLDLAHPNLRWRMELRTTASRDDIEAIFDFVGDLAHVDIARAEATPEPEPQIAPGAAPAPQAPPAASGPRSPSPSAPAAAHPHLVEVPPPAAAADPQRSANEGAAAAQPAAATIRVNLDRVDRLINQIGELVIMEAMLSQAISTAGLREDSDIAGSLEGIKQLAANIQESVMSIRAQPLKAVFQRMQRITREAADATGKQVRMLAQGEATEVDKTVIERLVDPLTHMIRNSVDHGIESVERRLAAGKPPEGQITLSAAHRSGRVIIEVSDDGGGIDRARVQEIAEARGLIPQGAQLAPGDIDNLLFMPGFSSKEEVSALSGRGVGLDVVRREIQSLGGRVTIQSVPGEGTTFTIALPLTLAVLEGMLIGIGSETLVLPLSSIIETLRPTASQLHNLGKSGRLIANRGELIPIIDLAECFGLPTADRSERSVLILVECNSGRKAALAADHIHDQRQIVIKSLENNYGSVPGISAATILGDGRIALIIDPEEIVQDATTDGFPRSLAANG